MSVPNLNRRLTLEHAVQTPDGAGGFTRSWESLGTLWATVVAHTGRERGGIAGAISLGRFAITVRAAPVGSASRPVAGQRFRDESRIFSVRAVTEADDAGLYLKCQADEEVAP